MLFGTRAKTSLALAMALLGGTAAQAAPLTSVSFSGTTAGFCPTGVVVAGQQLVGTCTVSSSLVTDGAAAGNVELGKYGVASGSLTGTGGGYSFTLASLTLADWTANSNQLAKDYIQGAAAEAGSAPLDSVALAVAVNQFLNVNVGSSGLKPWQWVSDPNIAYVDFANELLVVGLAGYFNAQPILQQLFPLLTVPAGVQVSEVVKVSVDGGDAQYLFSFSATATGLIDPGSGNFSGLYLVNAEVPAEVPEPASLALLGLGLVGLAAARRKAGKR